VLSRLISERGAPLHLRSDNGPEFVSRALLKWIVEHGIDTALIDPGKPWQNGAAESFMYGRPLRCKAWDEDWATTGRVRSCMRPVGAASSWPLALMEFADRRLINGSRWVAPKALRALSIPGPPGCAITSLSPSQFMKLAFGGSRLDRNARRRTKSLASHHQRPGDPRHFVGERNDDDLGRPTLL
jgi:hypothetical protein